MYRYFFLCTGAYLVLLVADDMKLCMSVLLQRAEPEQAGAEAYARFCPSPNMVSLNHSQASAEMVVPFTRFLLDAFENFAATRGG